MLQRGRQPQHVEFGRPQAMGDAAHFMQRVAEPTERLGQRNRRRMLVPVELRLGRP